MTSDAELHERFEAWVRRDLAQYGHDEWLDTWKPHLNSYGDTFAQIAWLAFQAGVAQSAAFERALTIDEIMEAGPTPVHGTGTVLATQAPLRDAEVEEMIDRLRKCAQYQKVGDVQWDAAAMLRALGHGEAKP